MARQRVTGDASAPPNVAANVKQVRKQRGLSLETLASLSGVSRAMLGQIETGKSVPTITVVWKIAKALSVPIASLITSTAIVRVVVLRAAELRTVSSNDGGFLQRPFLPPEFSKPFDFSEITLKPGHRETFHALPIGARASLAVTSGSIIAVLGDESPVTLLTGDSVLFQADIPHSLSNPGENPATAFLVSTPSGSRTA